MADSEMSIRSSRELWTILMGRSALRESPQIEAELNRYWDRLNQGLNYYKPPSSSSAMKLNERKDIALPLKDLALKVSQFLCLDEEQSIHILQCFLQEDYRGSRESLKLIIDDDRQNHRIVLKVAEYYYEERLCLLRCVLLLLTYFQDERHPYRDEFNKVVGMLEKDLVVSFQSQFENLLQSPAPTWETHGPLMTNKQASRWFVQCLKEQTLLLEIIFLYYAYFEMHTLDLLNFARVFKELDFGLRQKNKHLLGRHTDTLINRIGYFCCLILVEGMDIDFMQKCALEGCIEQHQFTRAYSVIKEMDTLLMTYGDIPPHGPVMLGWILLRHTICPLDSGPVVKKLGNTALQVEVFKYITEMLKALGQSGSSCTAITAKMCIYGLLSFVVVSFEEENLLKAESTSQSSSLVDAVCEVLSAPNLAEDFWEMKPNMGLGMILDNAVGGFPLNSALVLQLLTALCTNKYTVRKVYLFLTRISYYTEIYKNKPNNVEMNHDETWWRRSTPKLLFPLALGQTNLWLPQGVMGHVISAGEQGRVVRWSYTYCAWTLFVCEMEMLLHVVSTEDVLMQCPRVKPILDLVYKVLSTDWSMSDCLLPLTSRIYMVLQRLTSIIDPPLDMIASCVNCIAVMAGKMGAKVWSGLHRTGFLPFASSSSFSMKQCINADGMASGNYGNLLVCNEQLRGEYPVTLAFLRLVTTLVKGHLGCTLNKNLIPSALLVLKEILTLYHKWRYVVHGVREQIGRQTLELIHCILNLNSEEENQGSTPTLQSVCIYCLTYTEAGHALVNIMGMGLDVIEGALTTQPSSGSPEGPAQVLVQTVKLAFSVTNNAIRLKPTPRAPTPLEQALTQHAAQGPNLITVLARYIYHKQDQALPRLAVQLLKRLAAVAPMSIYACLGANAPAIRDAFLACLQSKTEDLRIKATILEFLTVSVETQPGLTELFLDLEAGGGSGSSKEFSLGEWSCLHVVLTFIDPKRRNPPLLQRAALGYLLALWQDRKDNAMSVLRKKERFWEYLTTPLFATLAAPSETSEPYLVDSSSYVMRLVGLEIYYTSSTSVEDRLKDGLLKFSNARRYEYWSQYIRTLVCHVAAMEGGGICYLNETQLLLTGWRMLLILSTIHADVMRVTEDSTKLKIFMDVLDGARAAVTNPQSECCYRLGSILTTLLVVLLKQWKSVVASAPGVLSPLSLILENVLRANHRPMERTKAKVLSSLICVLQIQGLNGRDISQLPQLLLCVLETVKDEALALVDAIVHGGGAAAAESADKMETDASSRAPRKDQRDQVGVVALHLAKELCRADEDGEHWPSAMRRAPVMPGVLRAIELSIQAKRNLHFTEAALHLLLTLARTERGASAVAGAGVLHAICLPLLTVYAAPTNTAAQSFTRKSQDAACWPGVYRLCVSLMESLLRMLRYDFIKQALDFLGVHQERFLQCVNAVRTVHSLACLDEADHTVGFLLQLSQFSHLWHFYLPDLLVNAQVSLSRLCQTCSYLLHNKKLLHHYLKAKNIEVAAKPRQSLQSLEAERLQREEAEQRALLTVQCCLVKILSKTLSALCQFTPDCGQMVQDQFTDLSEYKTLFVLSFTMPAFEPEMAPSFGTLQATINVVLNTLNEIEKKKEPPALPIAVLASSEEIQALRSLLVFSMENAFYVLVSQALRFLRDPAIGLRDKQRLKQELNSEMSTLLTSLYRLFRKGSPTSPASSLHISPQAKASTSGAKMSHEGQEPLMQLIQAFLRLLQR